LDDYELQDEQDPGQSAYADIECPDIAMPSKELIEITMLFMQWYMLYLRLFLPEDEMDAKEMIGLGDQ
jgi:hypothetical protein